LVTLTWVVDNVAEPPLRAEHGLAIWIDTPSGSVLLDTGATGEVLLHNLAALDLDPGRLDAVVLSHGHDDHTGGLPLLLPLLRPRTPLHGYTTLFRPRFSRKAGEMQSRGMPISESFVAERLDLRLSDEPVAVLPEVWTTGEIHSRSEPEGRSAHHFIYLEETYVADPYADDLSLVVRPGAGRTFLLCGCCHAGLLNTLEVVWATWGESLAGVAGGVHMTGASDGLVQRTATTLRSMEGLEQLWLGHCSGEAFLAALSVDSGFAAFHRGAAGQKMAV
jgi:7,8-dihydropterin-6-yl-methyl-4-(beta-D-ribofuranosyl)aminobenzene 5'-phosphate synthase